ncbi:DDE-type integrase/transposase/recombinase [Streptomyces sp. NPDC055709]
MPLSTPVGAATSRTSPSTRAGSTWPPSSTSPRGRVVGWATADHLRTELVAGALEAACRTRRPSGPVIFHSDRGCQYTSHGGLFMRFHQPFL